MSVNGQLYGQVALPRGKLNRQLNRILVEPESQSEQFGEKTNFVSLLEIKPRFL